MKYSYTLLTAAALILASPMPVEHSRASSAAASCESSFVGIFGIVLTASHVEALGGEKEARQVLSQIPDGQIQAPTHTTSVVTPPKPSSSTSKHSSQPPSSPCATSTVSTSKQSSHPPSSPCASSTSTPSSQSSTSISTSSASSTSKQSSTTPCADHSASAQQSSSTPCSGSGTPTSKTESATSMTMKPPVSQIGDGQIQNPGPSQPATRHTFTTTTTSTSTIIACTGSSSGCKPSERSSTHPATTPASTQPTTPKTTGTPVSYIPDGQLQVPTGKPQTGDHVGACSTDSTLKLSLSNGILKDARGWQGYIAANRQFQFDNPPQDGALITSGFSVCSNGSLALNGNNIFWECLSGNFYNLYDYDIAPQCRPVALQVAQLIKC